MSAADVDVVGQDRGGGAPDEAEPSGLSGEIRRAVDNLKSGNLGVLPIVLGLIFIVVFFSFKATNFFTAVNFVNILIQMAGTAMLAFGVVFVLLLGEIDLSISYVAGIGAVAVAELQLAGSGHQINGLLAMLGRHCHLRGDRLRTGLDHRAGGCPVVRRHARRLPDLAGRDLAGSRGNRARSSSRTAGSTTRPPTASAAWQAG